MTSAERTILTTLRLIERDHESSKTRVLDADLWRELPNLLYRWSYRGRLGYVHVECDWTQVCDKLTASPDAIPTWGGPLTLPCTVRFDSSSPADQSPLCHVTESLLYRYA